VLRFSVVAFLDEVALDSEFDPDELPLHVTLLASASTEADLDQVVTAVEAAYSTHGTFVAHGGDDELVGSDEIEATLVVDDGDLTDAHLALVVDLRDLGVRVDDPALVARNYRPFVPVAGEGDSSGSRTDRAGRIERGERIELRAIAVLDLAPDGDRDRVRVVDQFPLL
jgi:hypothetical protein